MPQCSKLVVVTDVRFHTSLCWKTSVISCFVCGHDVAGGPSFGCCCLHWYGNWTEICLAIYLVIITWRLPLWVYIFQAEVLRARGFLEVPKKQLYFTLQENRQDALARIRGALLKEGIVVDCVALELEFTSVGVCTLWPGELKYENGRYRLFGTLYGHLMDCHGRMLYRLFI